MQVQQILDRKGARIVTLSSDLPVSQVAKVMAEERIGTAMMADGNGRLIGILSERDIIRCIAGRGDIAGLPASALMSRSLITCTPDTDLEDVLTLMSEHTIRHLPVVVGNEVVGLISVRDVLDLQRELFIADMERRKQTEAAMRQAKEEAELASRTKSEFLANMSHELKTPLNAIVGFSDTLKLEAFGPLGSPQNRDFIAAIHKSGQHLLEIINDILDISRIETGARQPVDGRVDISRMMESCRRLINERAQTADIDVSTGLGSWTGEILGDERMIKQMLMNLLTNAVKFTPRGGRVTLHAMVGTDGGLALAVSDTGIGIARENIEKVLEPFSQIDGSLSRKFEGTGLGLALVNAMMQVHGGTVEIDSAPGEGTSVTLHFPPTRVLATPAAADRRLSA
jgi:signal transduction histidine kinase